MSEKVCGNVCKYIWNVKIIPQIGIPNKPYLQLSVPSVLTNNILTIMNVLTRFSTKSSWQWQLKVSSVNMSSSSLIECNFLVSSSLINFHPPSLSSVNCMWSAIVTLTMVSRQHNQCSCDSYHGLIDPSDHSSRVQQYDHYHELQLI